jgi:uncharacterized protein YndB with AHSA1/START domain
MTQTKTETTTLRLSRVFKAPRQRVYDAFLDADALVKWMAPNGYTAHVYKMDAKVGGGYRMSFSSLDKKDTHYFGGNYLELKPPERIRHTDKFESDDPAMQNEIMVTITFKEVEGGTEVTVVQENLPKIVPLEDAKTGWGQSFDNLARLVELPH